jgi:hypothetical protein
MCYPTPSARYGDRKTLASASLLLFEMEVAVEDFEVGGLGLWVSEEDGRKKEKVGLY